MVLVMKQVAPGWLLGLSLLCPLCTAICPCTTAVLYREMKPEVTLWAFSSLTELLPPLWSVPDMLCQQETHVDSPSSVSTPTMGGTPPPRLQTGSACRSVEAAGDSQGQ